MYPTFNFKSHFQQPSAFSFLQLIFLPSVKSNAQLLSQRFQRRNALAYRPCEGAHALTMKSPRLVTFTPEQTNQNLPHAPVSNTPQLMDEKHSVRMFSNLTRKTDGSLKREPPSELACIALVAVRLSLTFSLCHFVVLSEPFCNVSTLFLTIFSPQRPTP